MANCGSWAALPEPVLTLLSVTSPACRSLIKIENRNKNKNEILKVPIYKAHFNILWFFEWGSYPWFVNVFLGGKISPSIWLRRDLRVARFRVWTTFTSWVALTMISRCTTRLEQIWNNKLPQTFLFSSLQIQFLENYCHVQILFSIHQVECLDPPSGSSRAWTFRKSLGCERMDGAGCEISDAILCGGGQVEENNPQPHQNVWFFLFKRRFLTKILFEIGLKFV